MATVLIVPRHLVPRLVEASVANELQFPVKYPSGRFRWARFPYRGVALLADGRWYHYYTQIDHRGQPDLRQVASDGAIPGVPMRNTTIWRIASPQGLM